MNFFEPFSQNICISLVLQKPKKRRWKAKKEEAREEVDVKEKRIKTEVRFGLIFTLLSQESDGGALRRSLAYQPFAVLLYLYLVAYLSSYHEKAISALYELA